MDKRSLSGSFTQEMGSARSVWLETVTINEVLDTSGWRNVLLLVMFDQLESRTEFGMQAICIVLDHGEATALRWPVRCERGYDNVSAWLHSAHHLGHISVTICLVGQKMEDRAIVPYIKGTFWQREGCHVAFYPAHEAGFRSEASTGDRQCLPGEVQNGKIFVAVD
ncbi:hypothetical protein EOS_16450 [Caballeronia mineralivorans PML1(12)]|uniref:Uncharacterized protein n=1 Tax=Caballeronia mineralivorans PML1(12) TaxID=908627 RepID=A0A0J1CX65_9BURK|nr:hypothetical protein EOS_16450 [Caballeronia mineralivorans PML1(12)]